MSTDARPVIGRVRARFTHHCPWYVWLLPIGVPILVAALILLTGNVLAAVITLVLVLLLASLPIILVLRSFGLRVTDRAIVLGPFLPGVRREVHLFTDIDVTTLRAWSNVGAYLRASGMPALLTVGRIAPGSRQGISYLVRRSGNLASGQLTENTMTRDLGGICEVMSVTGSSERLVRALASAMEDARVAPAEVVLRTALPPGRLSPEPGAHLRDVPGHPQQQERFEDLPLEVQERVRNHIVE